MHSSEVVTKKFDKSWFKRTENLTFTDLLKMSEKFAEFKFYENELPKMPKILDVGVGLGYETAYYLQKGAVVHTLDADLKILNMLQRRCKEFADQLKIIHDIVPFNGKIPLKTKYDLIIASNVLHYLEYPQIQKFAEQIIPYININGFIIIRAHGKKHPYNKPGHPKLKEYKYFFSLDDLRQLFPAEQFMTCFECDYKRLYSEQECRLFGYGENAFREKNGISAVLKRKI